MRMGLCRATPALLPSVMELILGKYTFGIHLIYCHYVFILCSALGLDKKMFSFFGPLFFLTILKSQPIPVRSTYYYSTHEAQNSL